MLDFFYLLFYNESMRKTLVLCLIVLLSLAFSACSLTPQNTGTSVQTYVISKSIWKSTDNGKKWEAKDKAENKGTTSDVDALSMAINPYNSQNIYAGLMSGGLMKTDNGGDSWKFIPIFVSGKVYGLALDPADSKIVYASGVFNGRGKIFKSPDQGETWKEIYASAANGPLVISLAVDKRDSRVIYASTSDNEAIKSEDAGETWKNIFRADGPILKFSIDSSNSNIVYFLVDGGHVFRSRNAGEAFEDISAKVSGNFLGGNGFSLLETDPSNSNWVYLAGEGGILLSRDAGERWNQILALNDPKNFPITAFAINPKDSLNMEYGAGQAAYRTDDGGKTWSTSEFDTKRSISFIKYDPQNIQNIYLGFKK
jgi:photosystem II stability/assembly factor-like uncharacterized protein